MVVIFVNMMREVWAGKINVMEGGSAGDFGKMDTLHRLSKRLKVRKRIRMPLGLD